MFTSYIMKYIFKKFTGNWENLITIAIFVLCCIGLWFYVEHLKNEISSLSNDVAIYKDELYKESTEVTRLLKINDENKLFIIKLQSDANKSANLYKKQYKVTKSKETELLKIIESLKTKVNPKPKVKIVYKLKECKVTVSQDDPNDILLNTLNKQIKGL